MATRTCLAKNAHKNIALAAAGQPGYDRLGWLGSSGADGGQFCGHCQSTDRDTMANTDSRVTIHMAASLDGFIARKDGSVDWLETSDEFPDGSAMDPEFVQAF